MRGRALVKGSLLPPDNDSARLLDVHRRGVPGRERMRRFRHDDEVDMLIVGCGAGGGGCDSGLGSGAGSSRPNAQNTPRFTRTSSTMSSPASAGWSVMMAL